MRTVKLSEDGPMDIDEISEGDLPEGHERCGLLPRLLTLGLFSLLTYLLALLSCMWPFGIVISMIYLAVVILQTKDMLRKPDRMHPLDRIVCQVSGPLAVGIMVGILVVIITCASRDIDLFEGPIGSSIGILVLQYFLEIGVVFTTACLCIPPSLRHLPPTLVWKMACWPLLVLYGFPLVMMLMLPFMRSMEK